MYTPKIGDKVRITEPGKTYTNYADWAKINKLKNWKKGSVRRGTTGIISVIAPHTEHNWEIAGVQLATGKACVIGLGGFELVNNNNNMNDETSDSLLQEALKVKGKIQRIEVEVLADLETLLKQLSEKLLTKMEEEGLTVVQNETGDAVLVDRRGVQKIDEELLKKELGLSDLKKYYIEGKGSKYLKYNFKK